MTTINFNDVFPNLQNNEVGKFRAALEEAYPFIANPSYADVSLCPHPADYPFPLFCDPFHLVKYLNDIKVITPVHVEIVSVFLKVSGSRDADDLGDANIPVDPAVYGSGKHASVDTKDTMHNAYLAAVDWTLEKMAPVIPSILAHQAIKAPEADGDEDDGSDSDDKNEAERVAAASRKAAEIFQKDNAPTKNDVRLFLRKTIDSMNTFENIYGYADSLMGDHGESSAEARVMLKMIMFMNPSARDLLLNAIPKSGLVTACGPSDVVKGKDVAEKEQTMMKWTPPSPEVLAGVKSLVAAPPFVNSAAKQFVSPQDSRRHRLSIFLPDPTETGPGSYLLNDRIVPQAHKHHLTSRYFLEAHCLDNALKNFKDHAINEDLTDFLTDNLYTDDIEMRNRPSNVWSRFTMTFVVDKNSTALHPEIDTLKIYSMRAEEKKVSEFHDSMTNASVSNIPNFAFGAERLGVYSVVNNTTAGKKMIARFERDALKTVQPAKVDQYDDYVAAVHASLQLYSRKENRVMNLEKHRIDVNKFCSADVVEKFWSEQFQTKILPCLASHQGFRYNLQGEIAFGGVGVLALAKLADCFAGTKTPIGEYPALVMCCHTLACSLGYKIKITDGYSGQNLNGELISVDNLGDGRMNDMVKVSPDYKSGVEIPKDISGRNTAVLRTPSSQKSIVGMKGYQILVDLFIPGYLYNPQNENNRKLGIKYIGKKLLYDAPATQGYYSPAFLGQLNGFVVYLNTSQCRDTVDLPTRKAYTQLFKTHACYLAPTSVMHYHGMYLVGARRECMNNGGLHDGYLTTFASLTLYIHANISLKTRSLLEHYSRLPQDPIRMLEIGAGVAYKLKVFSVLGKTIGGRDAYKELLTKKEALVPIDAAGHDAYFEDSGKIAIAWKQIDDDEAD